MSRATQVRTRAISRFRLQDYHPLWSSFPAMFTYRSTYALLCALQPPSGLLETGLGFSRFARTTKGISSISLPGGTKIFQFPPFAHLKGVPLAGWVSPFRNLRVTGCLAPHRSLSQPYHVFHRLPLPRHPPCTLKSLQISCSSLLPYGNSVALESFHSL